MAKGGLAREALHPWAWWAWALSVAVAVNLTTNPLLLALMMCALLTVIVMRRTDAPWARSIAVYFWLAGIIIVVRLLFRVLVGGGFGGTVLFTLPTVALPDWMQGIRLGGEVTLDGLLYTLYDSLRLAVMLIAVAAANALANPRRALRSVPAALHDISVAVVIALSVVPQLVESVIRVRKARRLRGGGRGIDAIRAYLVPILSDAVDRSMSLAASMEARGFGRTRSAGRRRIWVNAGLLVSAMVATLGGFLVLNVGTQAWAGFLFIGLGAGGIIVGLRAAGDRVAATRYRPDPWGFPEWAVTACGLAVLAVVVALGTPGLWGSVFDPNVLNPSVTPPVWPPLTVGIVLVAGLTAAPLLFTRSPATQRLGAPGDGGASADPAPRDITEDLVAS